MNLCFLMGKIISDIEFKFVLTGKEISVVLFEIELTNKSVIKVKAYNEMADWCYQKLVKSDRIAIQGSLKNGMDLIVESLTIL